MESEDEFKLRLIEAVKQFPALYDVTFLDYKKKKKKKVAWKVIASQLGRNEEKCYKAWRSLTTPYGKMTRDDPPSGSGPSEASDWKFYSQMSFMKDHIIRRRTRPKHVTPASEYSKRTVDKLDNNDVEQTNEDSYDNGYLISNTTTMHENESDDNNCNMEVPYPNNTEIRNKSPFVPYFFASCAASSEAVVPKLFPKPISTKNYYDQPDDGVQVVATEIPGTSFETRRETDSFDSFAKNLADELRSLPSDIADIAKEEIYEILIFKRREARMRKQLPHMAQEFRHVT